MLVDVCLDLWRHLLLIPPEWAGIGDLHLCSGYVWISVRVKVCLDLWRHLMLIPPKWAGLVLAIWICVSVNECLDILLVKVCLDLWRHLMLLPPEWAGIGNLDFCIGEGMLGFLCW